MTTKHMLGLALFATTGYLIAGPLGCLPGTMIYGVLVKLSESDRRADY